MGNSSDIVLPAGAGDTDHGAASTRTAFRTCPLCEAGCGLELTVAAGADGRERVTRIRGDRADVFSAGFLCPKGSTLRQLHDDPDRLRRPLVRRDGVHVEVDWPEAWAEVARGLGGVIERHGRGSIAAYIGNPNAHNLAGMTFGRSWLHALGTRNVFSASTVDQMPRQVASAYVYGGAVTVPVPDLDRTDLLVVLGANPYASNGSLCTAPDFPGRIEAIRARGGRLVVVDPRRTRTADEADDWLPIRPGTDALFLAAMVHTLHAEDLVRVPAHVAPHVRGLDTVLAACARFTPEAVSEATGVAASAIRELARDLARTERAAVYGRIGTTTTEFGTTTSWLVDVVNLVAGNLDVVGGSMFPTPVASRPPKPGGGPGFRIGRGSTRVRQLPEVMGEYPAAALAEEITTPGDGQVRCLVTVAGNPVLSTPHSEQLDAALDELEFMVSVDIYLNETTRHADVILPSPSALQKSHYDLLLLQFAVRNVANYSPPVLALDEGQPDEWEVLARLAAIAQGLAPDTDPAAVDDLAIGAMVSSAVRDEYSAIHGRDPDEIVAELSRSGRRGPERMLDLMLQTGPFGAAFGAGPDDGASLDLLLAHPHGVDFGPLQPRLPAVLQTPSGMVELDHPVLVADLDRLAASWDDLTQRGLVLVGRRHLRSNNSWMHNVEVLVKGAPRCTLQVHPDDAARLGLTHGGRARVASRVGSLDAPVEVTDVVRPGVVSLPHGWGHDRPGSRLRVAAERAGVNSNVLTDDAALDPLSGTSVLNGIPVEVSPVPHAAAGV
ncbi:MAG: molybdopterin oxidoreductase family protein [Acidimicrobiales bacterium]|nr:molybdopterin oxidoreductase family protein [Acidimicrobiales bacterium]MCB9394575.1 molybdopterin-dependent oxidoreductase [Acidimicrobiaceae bacterium]